MWPCLLVLLGVLLSPLPSGAASVNRQHPLAQRLLAWFPVIPYLSNGLVWYDLFGDRYTVNGGNPGWTNDPTGRLEGMLEVGASQYTQLAQPFPYAFERTQPFTLSLTFAVTTEFAIILSKNNDGGAPLTGITCYTHSGGTLVWYFYDTSDVRTGLITDVGGFHDGKNHALSLVYTGNSNVSGMSIYVDGRRIPSTDDGSSATIAASIVNSLPWTVGSSADLASSGAGRYSNWLVHSRALRAGEVRTIAEMRAPTYGGLLSDRTQMLIQSTPSVIPIKRRVTIQ